MSHEESPNAPVGGAGPDRPERPQYGEYAPPGWIPPEPQPEWSEPQTSPQPGLIPLRPLFLGDILGAAFKTIRHNPRPTFWLALVIGSIASIISLAIVGLVMWNTLQPLAPSGALSVTEIRSVLAALACCAAVAALVQAVLTAIPQAVVTLDVALASLGERPTVRALWSRARGRIGALIGWMLILAGIGVAVVLLLILGLGELVLTGGVAGAVTALGVGILLGLGLLVVSAWIGTKLAFVPALIIIERLPIAAAVRRSWALTAGSFWRILGITLLTALIVQVGAQVVMLPVSFLTAAFGPTTALDPRSIVVLVIGLAIQLVVSAVAVVLQTAVATLLYLDARMRREGLDSALRAHTAARPGDATVPDPLA